LDFVTLAPQTAQVTSYRFQGFFAMDASIHHQPGKYLVTPAIEMGNQKFGFPAEGALVKVPADAPAPFT
jgi:hypothetical protein